ncbi:MAG: exopolyphosphatase / guanosine-5-triphosphate,3-diphosphate pyrophosphatase [Gaiellales bacterium]|jgi:exopolyphosphatase/guanosine-5'-triphosphate,3'-diphosphate pyrophosphatase|nr:exopolyphosphatase / guanosine-5-triphosphate,3-diphosphate pyrophosphatase [Gaiellales bacterium]
MRVASADIGTNSTRLLVADVGSDGSVAEIERLLEITRLGEGVDAGGTLGEAPMRRVTTVLERYAERARALGAERLLAVATSAVRDASNRGEFMARVAATGFEPRLLSGDEEAATTFAGVRSRAPGGEPVSSDGTLVIDVGGGSTELVLGGPGGVAWSRSLQAGCVRMTERFLGEDVIADDAFAACGEAVDRLLAVVPDETVAATRRAIAVAGTATTIAAIANGGYDAQAVHDARLTRDEVHKLQTRLAALPLAERRSVPGLEPERAPVIVAGLAVLGRVLDRFGLREAIVSERDILHGAALLAASA